MIRGRAAGRRPAASLLSASPAVDGALEPTCYAPAPESKRPVILTHNDRSALPPPGRLESTALALRQRRDFRNLVRFVHRWGELGEPSYNARLAEAEAFVELRLMDRAAIRLSELTENDACKAEALRLAARMYLLRGWPTKARRSLEIAMADRPGDPELQKLWEQAAQPARPPDPAREHDATPDELLALAESYAASGSFLRAQSLLERLNRMGQHTARVDELLWAFAGDFRVHEPLDDLVRRWGPEISYADFPDEGEHTESIEPDEGAVDAVDEGRSFPSLFRHFGQADDDDTGEVTQASRMTSLHGLLDDFPAASPDAPTSVEAHEDTQIMMIIRRDGATERRPVDGPIHRYDEESAAPVPFNLADFQREMGVGVSPITSDFDPGLEEEDDDLIVLTAKERSEAETSQTDAAGSQLLEPDPTSSEIDVDVVGAIRAHSQERTASEERPRPKRRRSGGSSVDATPVWILVLTGLLLVAVFVLFAIALAQVAFG